MIVKTIIKQEEPTVNDLIYPKGSLQKMKDLIQDRINQKTFFVFPPGFCDKVTDLTIKDAIGIVNNLEITDGQGWLDITLIKDIPLFSVLDSLDENNLRADFLLVAAIGKNNYVDLTNVRIDGVKLTFAPGLFE